MPIKDAKIVCMRGNVTCIYCKSAKHIIDIRGMSAFECPGDSLKAYIRGFKYHENEL